MQVGGSWFWSRISHKPTAHAQELKGLPFTRFLTQVTSYQTPVNYSAGRTLRRGNFLFLLTLFWCLYGNPAKIVATFWWMANDCFFSGNSLEPTPSPPIPPPHYSSSSLSRGSPSSSLPSSSSTVARLIVLNTCHDQNIYHKSSPGSASSASREGSQSRQLQLPKKTSSDLLSGESSHY